MSKENVQCCCFLRVAEVVGEHLQLISTETVLVEENMVMSRPACSLLPFKHSKKLRILQRQ